MMSDIEFHNDLDKLLAVMPPKVISYITAESLNDVIEIVLDVGRIAEVRQHELDRIIFIDVDTIGTGGKIQTVTLACELIGKYSNIILISENKIIDALKKIGTNSSRVRTVLPNQNYQMPPEQNKFDIFSVNLDEVTKNLQADK